MNQVIIPEIKKAILGLVNWLAVYTKSSNKIILFQYINSSFKECWGSQKFLGKISTIQNSMYNLELEIKIKQATFILLPECHL